MTSTTTQTAAEAAASADLGKPSARKSGRSPQWPYVPVVIWTDDVGRDHDRQIIGKAFATRDEAVDYAARCIAAERTELERKLNMPNHRALRRQYGVES